MWSLQKCIPYVWFLWWKFCPCIEGISASMSRSETTLLACIWNRCNVTWENQEISCYMHMLDIIHNNSPSTGTHQISSAIGLSQSAVWYTDGESVVSFPCTTSKIGCSQGTNISISSSWVGVTQKCGHPSVSVPWVVDWWGSIYKKWRARSTHPACRGNRKYSCYSSFLKDLVSMFGPES
jgi:hypothetical protein